MGADLSVVKNAESSEDFARAFIPNYDPDDHLGQGSLLELVPGLSKLSKDEVQGLRSFVREKHAKLKGQIKKLAANGNVGFVHTFTGITDGNGSPATASTHPDNQHLNRYSNIVAYDATRVKLTPYPENYHCDYINASWIESERPGFKYIAAQGPVPASLFGFWQMAWEQNSKLVVMVTNEVESGRLKCHRYWPDAEQPIIEAGLITVNFDYEEVFPTYVQRHFTVSWKGKSETRNMTQMAYTAWPDHGVPATTKELLGFRMAVDQQHKKLHASSNAPLLVHCSAGVGRTGTFIGVDRFIHAVLAKQDVEVIDLVRNMRRSRNFMVQSQIQFVYLYLACLDACEQIFRITTKYMELLDKTEEQRQEEEIKEITEEIRHEEAVVATIKLKEKEQRGDARDLFPAPAAAGVAEPPPPTTQVEPEEPAAEDPPAPATASVEPPPQPKIVVPPKPAPARQPIDYRQYDDPRKVYDASAHIQPPEPEIGASAKDRLESIKADGENWRNRSQVPLSTKAKGYNKTASASLGKRLAALIESKEAWKQRYEQAQAEWKLQQESGGVEYQTGKDLTPLESRLQSLANAEEAWRYRSDGVNSAKEEEVRRQLAALSSRLKSLSHTIVNNDKRWQAKGHGFRTKPVREQRQHTVDLIGGLIERVEMLSKEQDAWRARDHYEFYVGKESYSKDVEMQRERQAMHMKGKHDYEQAKEEAAAAAQAKAEQEAAEARAKAEAEAKEERRKQDIRDRMKESSVLPDTYNPSKERSKKMQKAEEKERRLQQQREEAAAREAAAAAKAQAKLEAKSKANKKASKFLKKLRK